MLPKSKRLTQEHFKGTRPRIFFRGELFDIASLPLPGTTHGFACVIAKKTLAKAVDRNLVKRRIFGAVETLKIEELLKQNSFIIYPKKIILTTPFLRIDEEIKKAFATLQ